MIDIPTELLDSICNGCELVKRTDHDWYEEPQMDCPLDFDPRLFVNNVLEIGCELRESKNDRS
jgi:hypothetical protein